jgi:iron(III) transport system ATP-binding protein
MSVVTEITRHKANPMDAKKDTPSAVLGADLSVQNLGKRYGDKWVVRDLSFVVPGGSFLSIVGPSGCGKSTTLRLIAGLDRPDSGEIRIGPTSMSSSANGVSIPAEKRKIGFVFQSYALWPHMTVFEHVLYPLRGHNLSREQMVERVEATLSIVGLEDLKPRYPSELSGGQQQRVALARAVVQEPAILLLDEPLSNLDAALRARMGLEVRSLQRQLQFTAIYVTHDRVEALSLSDRVMVMNEGRAIEYGTPLEVYEQPQDLFSARFVSGANTLPGTVLSTDGNIVRVRLADGGAVIDAPAKSRAPAVKVGDDVWVATRPEAISITSERMIGGANLLPATVETVTYFGAYCDVLTRVGESPVNARVDPAQAMQAKVGEALTLALPVSALVVLPRR